MTTENQEQVVTEGVFSIAELFGQTEDVAAPEDQTIIEQIEGELTPPEQVAPPEKEEEPKPEPTPKEVKENPNAYLEFIREAIEEGDYEDVLLELEDGTQIELSKLDKVDKTLFQQIKKAQKELQAEKIKEKYISAEGLDETTKRLVELKRNGEDISELIKAQIDLKNPLEGLDLEDPKVQKWLLFEEYKAKGIDPDIAVAQIEKLEKEFKLDIEAKKVSDHITKSLELANEQKIAAKEKEVQDRIEAQKKYRKDLGESYKQFTGLNETKIRSLVDNATKQDSTGKTNFDKLLDEVRKDPVKMAELNYYLNDEKGFMEFKTAKVKTETQLKTIKVINSAPRTDKTAPEIEKDDNNPWAKVIQTAEQT